MAVRERLQQWDQDAAQRMTLAQASRRWWVWLIPVGAALSGVARSAEHGLGLGAGLATGVGLTVSAFVAGFLRGAARR